MIRRLTFTLIAALVAMPLTSMADDAKLPPICKMNDADVHLTGDGWAGPNCITADATGKPNPAALKAAQEQAKKGGKPAEKKPLCKMGDPGVTTTIKGWAGPNCTTADAFGNPAD